MCHDGYEDPIDDFLDDCIWEEVDGEEDIEHCDECGDVLPLASDDYLCGSCQAEEYGMYEYDYEYDEEDEDYTGI